MDTWGGGGGEGSGVITSSPDTKGACSLYRAQYIGPKVPTYFHTIMIL